MTGAGTATGVGSLPHRDAHAAAEFVLRTCPDLPAIPSLPRRSPAEGMIAQAVVGIRGVTAGQYGSLSVDVDRIDVHAPVVTDIEHDAFGGLRAFLTEAAGRRGPVKWQFTGPVTLGQSLVRAGVPESIAYDVALGAVRSHLVSVHRAVADALPECAQVVVIDEPCLHQIMLPGFPLAPDGAVDLVSGALAALEPVATVGVHCCSDADWPSVLAAGPQVLSLPVSADLVSIAGYIARFLDSGGIVAWGVIATDGPIPATAERPWRQLSDLWCQLVQHGCDPLLLRQRAWITPACGLGLHSEGVAEHVATLVSDVAHRVRNQSTAARLTLGA
jgi:methionine synthase II (cobalamin-independent)